VGGYADALAYLYGLEPRGIRLELDRMRAALALRGDPHLEVPVVHVAGSNGKGSVAAMVAAGLARAGYRTGLYTSPHLHRFVERVRVDGRPVRQEEVTRGVRRLRRTLDGADAPELTFFEATTLLAFELFRDRGCDVAVLEVGLGGRLDATNVVASPAVCAITRLALEHTARLGTTLEAIAGEKAGILKAGVPVAVGVREPGARRVVGERARSLGAPVAWIDQDFAVEGGEGRHVAVRVGERHLGDLPLPLAGAHQRDNVAIAVAALVLLGDRGFPVHDRAIREGLSDTRWPGRLETLRGRPPVLLDASHNPDGCAALGAHLDALPTRGRRVLVFGAMEDKDHQAMLAAFDGRVSERIYAEPALRRAVSAQALTHIRPGRVAPDVARAVAWAKEAAGPQGLVVVAGSVFVMAEARAHLLGRRTDPPIAM
jgi:dihydrofolate synthase / folylpolyglutamate synthase